MKRAINLRLSENILITLERLSEELNTTKTDIIERSINYFSKKNSKNRDNILKYAGVLDSSSADNMLLEIKSSKSSKDFSPESL